MTRCNTCPMVEDGPCPVKDAQVALGVEIEKYCAVGDAVGRMLEREYERRVNGASRRRSRDEHG